MSDALEQVRANVNTCSVISLQVSTYLAAFDDLMAEYDRIGWRHPARRVQLKRRAMRTLERTRALNIRQRGILQSNELLLAGLEAASHE